MTNPHVPYIAHRILKDKTLNTVGNQEAGYRQFKEKFETSLSSGTGLEFVGGQIKIKKSKKCNKKKNQKI